MKMSSESAGGAKSAPPAAIADRGRSSDDDGAGDDAASTASYSNGELFSDAEYDEAPVDDSDGANGEFFVALKGIVAVRVPLLTLIEHFCRR